MNINEGKADHLLSEVLGLGSCMAVTEFSQGSDFADLVSMPAEGADINSELFRRVNGVNI